MRQPHHSPFASLPTRIISLRLHTRAAKLAKPPESMMDLISLLIVFVVVGVVLWLIVTYIPMPAPMKNVLMVVVVLILCIWLLQSFGLAHLRIH